MDDRNYFSFVTNTELKNVLDDTFKHLELLAELTLSVSLDSKET